MSPVVRRSRSPASDEQSRRWRERLAWALVAVVLVADVVLTGVGLAAGFTEANPVARAAMAAVGVVPAMVLLKGGAVAVGLLAWVVIPRSGRFLVPVALAVPWGIAVVVNVAVITGGAAGVPPAELPVRLPRFPF